MEGSAIHWYNLFWQVGSSNDKAIEPNTEVDHISSLSQKCPANWKVYSRRKKRISEMVSSSCEERGTGWFMGNRCG